MSKPLKTPYRRPKRFRLSEMLVGSLVELSYGTHPLDQHGPYEVTECRPSGNQRGYGDRITCRDPSTPAQSMGVGFPVYRVGRVMRRGPAIPPIDTSPANLAYISSLKVGEQVIECGQSCMTGVKGTVYESKDGGGTCVKWNAPSGQIGTSVTWGTRRLTDAPSS